MRYGLFALAAALLVTTPATAQIDLEVELGGGYTLADIETIADNDNENARDWSQGGYHGAVRAFFSEVSGMRLGAEVGYHYLYWYQVRVPFGDFPFNREYDVTGTSAMGVLRLGGTGATIDVGAGIMFLDDPLVTTRISVGFEVMERLTVGIRADPIIADVIQVPVGVAVSYAFSLQGN